MLRKPPVTHMELKHWQHEILDLSRQSDYREVDGLSVLANAVECLNTRLLARLQGNLSVLEIGCGAHSLLKDQLKPPAIWEGIDVIDADRKGRPSVATRRASVDAIPWPDETFDYVVSNQSIEHWHEYGVPMERGLCEIRRVLKRNGAAIINFPVHLHGNNMFVTGKYEAIEAEFKRAGLNITRRTAVIKSAAPAYQGWRKCGFPDFLVTRQVRHEATSYIVEYEAAGIATAARPNPTVRPRTTSQLNVWQRHMQHGVRYLLWKVWARLLRIDRSS
jgi:SAM-dependent methyltransferase